MATFNVWTPSSQWGQDLYGYTQYPTGYGMPTASSLQFGNMPAGNPITTTQDLQTGVDDVLGWNANTLKLGLSGLNTLGNLWGAWQSNKLARDQLNFTKDVTNTNLNNSIQSYNTSLEDRARARAAMEGQSNAEAQAYIDKNRLTR